MLGRRGPAQAAFTSAELRELGRLDGVHVRVDPADLELDPVSSAWLAEEGTFTARKNVELLREFAARGPEADASRQIDLRFLSSPVEISGDGRVEAVTVRRNEIVRDDEGALRARPAGDEVETIECGLVLRSVGYQAVPLPDVPFEERRFVLPNVEGRVLTPDGQSLPGVYTVGWIKRGPTGILGTNKRDAEQTVACLVEDLRDGLLPEPAQDASASTRCSPSAARRSSAPTAGGRSPAPSSSAAAPSSAPGSSWRRATSCSPPRADPHPYAAAASRRAISGRGIERRAQTRPRAHVSTSGAPLRRAVRPWAKPATVITVRTSQSPSGSGWPAAAVAASTRRCAVSAGRTSASPGSIATSPSPGSRYSLLVRQRAQVDAHAARTAAPS